MRGKQIAFQFTNPQFAELVRDIRRATDAHPQGVMSMEDWLTKHVADPKTRDRWAAAARVCKGLEDRRANVTQVKRVIVWRGDDGKPGRVETHFFDFRRERR